MNAVFRSDSCGSVVAATRLTFPRRAPSGPLPLTLQQQWAWSHYMQPEVPYIVGNAKRLRGPLSPDILCRGLGSVIERHESLRTRITTVEGVPGQMIDEPDEFCLKVLDFSAVCSTDREEQAGSFVHDFFWRQLNLENGPLFEVRLLRLSEDDHILLVVVHHLLSDAVSFNILFRELWTSYQALARGGEVSLPPLPTQYGDYAVWQRDQHQHWMDKHGEYWQRRIASAFAARLTSDHGLCHVREKKVENLFATLDEVTSSGVRELARRTKMTTSHVMLAVYAALLSHWTGKRDFVIPYIVSGRMGSWDRHIIGCLGQFLVLRIELTGHENFIDVLQLVTREFFAAYTHLDFGKVISERPDLLKGVTLNGVMESMDALSQNVLHCGDHDIAIEEFPVPASLPEEFRMLWDAYFVLWSTPEHLCVRCQYKADLFRSDTIGNLLEDLQSFARQVVRDPQALVSSLFASRASKAHGSTIDARTAS